MVVDTEILINLSTVGLVEEGRSGCQLTGLFVFTLSFHFGHGVRLILRAHVGGAESVLYTIRCAGRRVIPTPECRIDFDNFVLRTLDPFLLALARDSFLGTLGR